MFSVVSDTYYIATTILLQSDNQKLREFGLPGVDLLSGE